MMSDQWAAFSDTTPEKVGNIITGFAFTMMGFLVASLMVLSLFSESRAMRQYRSSPYIKTLIVHVGLTLIELALIFVWGLSLEFTPPSAWQVKFLALASIGGLGMTLLCCFPILIVQYRAAHERKPTAHAV
jgi:hypothetical protein